VRSSYSHKQTNGIVNLSNYILSPAETEILNFGHSFVSKPAPINSQQAKRQLNRIVYNKPTIDRIVAEAENIKYNKTLTFTQVKLLKNLRNNPSIVITQADKGDSWVILNKDDYVWECNRQLLDESVYRPLPASQTTLNSTLFRNVLLKMLKEKVITKSKFEYLVPKDDTLKDRIFYILPKIHKSPATWKCDGTIPPGRPIVGNSFSEDTKICIYIDSFLKPIVNKQPYILSNTDHLLTELEKIDINKNSILFSMDVSSLYTNIPIIKGILAIKSFFEKFRDESRPDKYILELLKLSLLKNDFLFMGKYYRQTKGVAMGKQYAPNFANLYMSMWEDSILNKLQGPKPRLWLRYIDDIFGIWEGPLQQLINFVNQVNSFDKDIQVCCNTSFSEIQFLDLIIYKTNSRQLSTMVYLKPTSSLKLIHPLSLHPSHTKGGTIFSQILRFAKNCTFDGDFKFHLKSLFQALSNQGYTRTYIRNVKRKALSSVNYQVSDDGKILKGFFPCAINCKLCTKHGSEKTSISFSGGGKIITQFLTCSSKNAIYVIYCQKCPLLYVGETKNSVKQRMSQHLSTIKLKYQTPVSLHFNSENHSIDDFRFFVLTNNISWTKTKRKSVENNWIKKLNTLTPNGINVDTNKLYNKFVTLPFKGRSSIPTSLKEFLNDSTKTCYTTGSPLRVVFNHKHSIARNI
jgi:hypothetical protein